MVLGRMELLHLSDETLERIVRAKAIAVVGASRNPDKYGHMVYMDLKLAGKTVYGINPSGAEIDGDPTFASLSDLPVVPEAAVFVVPPAVTAQGLAECARLGIRDVWLQEGAEPENAAELIESLGLNGVYGGPCIMVLLRTHGLIARA